VESWVLQRTQTGIRPLILQHAWLTDLWRSPSGSVFVASEGTAHRLVPQPDPLGWKWNEDELPASLAGIWGLDDRFVFTWGELGDRNAMYLWNGSAWREVPSPGYVNGVHGISPDLIYAVGRAGLLARWNGTRWDRLPSYTSGTLSRVFVASADQMYAVGAGRSLLEGSIHGWSELLVADGQLHDVAVHRGKVWVAAGPDGLFTLQGNKLANYSTKITPEHFDARGELIISARTMVLQLLPDGKFQASGVQGFIDLAEDEPDEWMRKIR
jgi:hypothetical protein